MVNTCLPSLEIYGKRVSAIIEIYDKRVSLRFMVSAIIAIYDMYLSVPINSYDQHVSTVITIYS